MNAHSSSFTPGLSTSVELFAYLGGRASVCELQEPKMIRITGLQRADQRLNFREFA
jgi:enolase